MKQFKTVEYTDKQLQKIIDRSAREDATAPRAAKAAYKAGKICLTLKNGVELRIPARLIQGLQGATVVQLSNVLIAGEGEALFWDDLDVQMSTEGLVAGLFGTTQWMQGIASGLTASDVARMGGRVKSATKTAAVRENGKKGGRPRKTLAA